MKEFDYKFREIRYILCSLIPPELKKYDDINNEYEKEEQMIWLFITQDEEIVKILTSKKDFNSVINEVLELNEQRLLKKEPFHRWVEKNYPNIDYRDYRELYLYYEKLSDEYKKEAKEIVQEFINEAVEHHKNTLRMSMSEIDPLNLRYELLKIFENTIKETRDFIKMLNDGKRDFDWSMTNFLDECEAVWIGALRHSAQTPKIVTSFLNNNKILATKGKYGWYFKDLSHSLEHIMRIKNGKSVDNDFFIAHEILRAFNHNKEIAEAVCCQTYKINNVKKSAIMNVKTFKGKMKSQLFKEFGLSLPK